MESIYINYYLKNNLPNHEAIIPNQIDMEFKALKSTVYVNDEANQNLTTSHKKITLWHFRLGHIGFNHVQWLICAWHIKVKGNYKAVANCERTKCAACEFGKCHCRPNKVKITKKNNMKEQDLKKDHLLPGQILSADHYI